MNVKLLYVGLIVFTSTNLSHAEYFGRVHDTLRQRLQQMSSYAFTKTFVAESCDCDDDCLGPSSDDNCLATTRSLRPFNWLHQRAQICLAHISNPNCEDGTCDPAADKSSCTGTPSEAGCLRRLPFHLPRPSLPWLSLNPSCTWIELPSLRSCFNRIHLPCFSSCTSCTVDSDHCDVTATVDCDHCDVTAEVPESSVDGNDTAPPNNLPVPDGNTSADNSSLRKLWLQRHTSVLPFTFGQSLWDIK